MLTQGIRNLDEQTFHRVLSAVRNFDVFTPDNDPWKEHDFGMVMVCDVKCYWKIDYYDNNLEFHSPDKNDPAVTTRVLTIMLADEY